MSNLYKALDQLKQFYKDKDITENQRSFIFLILGMLDEPLDAKTLIKIKSTLVEEILKISSMLQPKSQAKYLKVLNDVVHHFEALEKARERTNKLNFQRYDLDSLYSKTLESFNGTIMLPVNQGLDFRLGDSEGECFGYIAEWASKILKKQNPFGVNAEGQSLFRPVYFNSKVGRKYPDLNHLAILNEDIASYQIMQLNKNDLMSLLSMELKEIGKSIGYSSEKPTKFYSSVDELVEQLVQSVNEDPMQVYNLNVYSYLSGHALGFCKLNNKYHFFDSNSGWFRFENLNDFKTWLPYYFQTIGYNKIFSEYTINQYGLRNESLKDAALERKADTAINVLHIALNYLSLPFIIIALLFNKYVIRGFQYAALAIKKLNTVEEAIPVLKPISFVPVTIPESLDYLDLAVNKNPERISSKTSSFGAIAGMLDLPKDQLAKVAKRAATNDEFKRAEKKPILSDFNPMPTESDSSALPMKI